MRHYWSMITEGSPDFDPDVRRWYRNLKEGSENTANNYLAWLADYSKHRGVTPQDFLSEFDADRKVLCCSAEDHRVAEGPATRG